MRKCATKCMKENVSCRESGCRMWIDYEDDHNCALIAIEKNGDMTLHEVAERLNISYVRVKQIQDKTLQKVGKRMLAVQH